MPGNIIDPPEPLAIVSAQPPLALKRPAARHSLRMRLSLLMTLLVAAVLALFLFASNRALTRATRQAGNERSLAASTQIANVLGQNSLRGLTELRRIAADPVLSAFISTPTAALRAEVDQRLRPLAVQQAQGPIALLTNAGESVYQIVGPNAVLKQTITGVPSIVGVGPLRHSDDGVFADVVVPVAPRSDAATDERGDPATGYLVLRRTIRAGANADTINRLIGAGAMVAIGNRDGTLWTDLTGEVAGPPIDATHSGLSSYQNAHGEMRTGGLAVIEGTPWAVWIDLGDNVVLAPARIVLVRMTYLALGCVVLAIVAGAVLSRHIVKPLDDLTRASEEMAAGALDTRVATSRRDEIGRLATAFNVMSDHVATAQRELEARVQQRTAELEDRATELAAVNRELEAFSYSVSHDLRAPLRHIHGFVGLLEQSAGSRLGDDERRWLETIARSSSRMGRLIDDLLDFSRTSRATLTPHPVDLNALISDVRKDFTSDASIEWRVASLPTVAAEAPLLRQVFVNLIGNAVKYSRGRSPQKIEIGTAPDEHNQAIVFVRDNGVGFDMRYAKKLFGVFQRLHSDEQFEGTGIGLANVQRIVHRHGGRVWAESALDEGATFYVALPHA